MNDLLILALLLDGPKHGYALKKQAGFMFAGAEMHNNLVYPLLRRFVRQGWVSRRRAAGARGQTRLVYSITRAGRSALEQRLIDFTETDARSPQAFRIRVGLFEILSCAVRTEILDRRKKFLESRVERLRLLRSHMDAGPYGGEVVRFLQLETEAELAWIERLRGLASRKQRAGGSRRGT